MSRRNRLIAFVIVVIIPLCIFMGLRPPVQEALARNFLTSIFTQSADDYLPDQDDRRINQAKAEAYRYFFSEEMFLNFTADGLPYLYTRMAYDKSCKFSVQKIGFTIVEETLESAKYLFTVDLLIVKASGDSKKAAIHGSLRLHNAEGNWFINEFITDNTELATALM